MTTWLTSVDVLIVLKMVSLFKFLIFLYEGISLRCLSR